MSWDDIRQRWLADRPMYKKWGKHVLDLIERRLVEIIRRPPDDFLEIVKMRTKEKNSLEDKIARKGYNYEDITDKVGVRFVVLREEDIGAVDRAINVCASDLDIDKKRSIDADRQNNPECFSYHGNHYVVRNKESFFIEDTEIAKGTPCEVQVRTLLQHAFDQLEHHYAYKRGAPLPKIQRHVAKCRALGEIANDSHDLFIKAVNESKDAKYQAYNTLINLYKRYIGEDSGAEKSNMIILDAFDEKDFDNLESRINALLRKYPKMKGDILNKRKHYSLFRQSVILFVYLMVEENPFNTPDKWPISEEPLRMVYSALGRGF